MLVLQTSRLTLRHFTPADADALQAVLGDAEVMEFGPEVRSADEIALWIDRQQQRYADQAFGLWAVVPGDGEQAIGYCGLMSYPDINGSPEVELGYRLARAHWGRGLATEAATAVRDLAFDAMKLDRLIALIDPANARSIRVAEKVGMSYEADVVLPGYTHPDHVYVCSRGNGF